MSRSKADKEREKVLQERCQILLTRLLKEEDNKYCVDCDSKGPRWASWNLGIFLCIRCAGIHRNLGVHISKVRSVNLDSWTPVQVSSMQCMGNSRGRGVYEASVPDDFKRPTSDSGLEQFIRAKYEKKKYIMKDWVATKPPDLPEGWNLLIEQEKLGKNRDSKMAVMGSSSNTVKASDNSRKPDSTSLSAVKSSSVIPAKTSPAPVSAASAARSTTGVTSSASCSAVDLLGLSSNTSSSQDDDLFSNFVSAPPAVTSANSALSGDGVSLSSAPSSANKSTLEHDFFNQVSSASSVGLPGTANPGASTDPSKMSNSSIMALFSSVPQNKGPSMIASPAAPQAMAGYPSPHQPQQQQHLYPGQQQHHQAFQQQNYIQPSSAPFFNNNVSTGLDPLAALGGFGAAGQKGMSSPQPGQGVFQMNNQFSGLNVNGGVQGQTHSQPILNSNHNQLNAANITGLYNMSGNTGSPAGHNLSGLQSAPNLFSSPGQLGAGAAIFSSGSGAGGQIPGSGQANQQHTPSFASWN